MESSIDPCTLETGCSSLGGRGEAALMRGSLVTCFRGGQRAPPAPAVAQTSSLGNTPQAEVLYFGEACPRPRHGDGQAWLST